MRKTIISCILSVGAVCSAFAQGREASGQLSFGSYAAEESGNPTVSLPGTRKLVAGEFRSGVIPPGDSGGSRFKLVRKGGTRSVNKSDCLGQRTVIGHVSASHASRANVATVSAGEGDTLRIEKFFYSDLTINAILNEATGELTIPAQHVIDIEGMPVWLCKMDLHRGIYDPTAGLKGVVANGNLHIEDSFGFFVTDGAQKGAYLNIGLMEYAVVATPNAEISTNRITYTDNVLTTANRVLTPVSNTGYAYPMSSDKYAVMGVPVGTSFTDIEVNLLPGEKVSIDPQPVFLHSLLGEFAMYGLTETVSGDAVKFSTTVTQPIPAQWNAADSKLGWGKWAVASTAANSLLYTYDATTVKLQTGISFPQAVSYAFEGKGTQAEPYLIKTATDFMALASGVANNEAARGKEYSYTEGGETKSYIPVYEGVYFKIDADIDFASLKSSFTPIGTSQYFFSGILDGDNHTISNFTIEKYAYDYCGLFGRLGHKAEVRNITFTNPYVNSIGYTAGVLAGKSYAKISNITLNSPKVVVNVGYNAGALVGYSYNEIKDVTVSGLYISSLGYMGGVAGRSYANITNAHVSGRVAMLGKQVFAGGIVGHQSKQTVNDPNPVMSGCSYTGSVTASGNEIGIGGIAGAFSYSSMERCFADAVCLNMSNISSYVGGLVGTSFSAAITDCYASGFVRNPETTYAGGLVGHNSTSTSEGRETVITNCYSSAMLASKSTDANRGLAGSGTDIRIVNSFFDNQIAVVPDGVNGKSTAELTSAAGIDGFSTDRWVFEEGCYPRLKGLDSSDAAVVSAAAIKLPAGENISSVSKDFSYSTTGGVTWSALVDGARSSTGGYAFTFNNGVAKLNYEQVSDTIFVSKGAAEKYYFINIAPIPFEGKGTQAEPWKLATKEHVIKLSEISNNAAITFDGKYFALTNDIDFAGDTIQPICKDKAAKLTFQGVIDGNGHSIRNMKMYSVGFFTEDNVTGTAVPGQVNPKDENSYNYGGFVGNLGAKGVIRNLTFDSGCEFHAFSYGGAFAGGSEGLIENCANYGKVRVYFSNGGGIVGTLKAGGVVKGCYNGGSVWANANTVGGIAGSATSASISECENTGDVAACFFNPYQKEASQYGAGGIVGLSTYSTVKNVVNSGNISSYKQVGGIASSVVATAAKPSVIENAVNYGFVSASAEKVSLGAISGISTLATFTNCFTDKQLQKVGPVANNKIEGVTIAPTATMVSGKLPLPAESWNLAEGTYPTMKYDSVPAQVAVNSRSVISFKSKDFANSMTETAALSQGPEWKVISGMGFMVRNNELVVMLPMAGCFTDTVVAQLNGAKRCIPVATLNPSILDGDGTAERPFQIREASEFLTVARFMKQWNYDYEGFHFKVMNDLDFNGMEFVPMGDGGVAFSGSFDGNGMKFKNVNCVADATDKTAVNKGLFGIVGYTGSVSNIVLDPSCVVAAYSEVGGVAGALYGTMSGCRNEGAVTALGTMYAGGMAGKAYPGAVIANCVNKGDVGAKTNYAGGVLGGSAADASVMVTNCSNEGTVAGASKIGGVVGSASALLDSCSNTGDVIASGTYAAGVIAEALLPSSVKNCINSGDIQVPQYMAGVIAVAAAHTNDNPFYLHNCENKAPLSSGAKGYSGGVASTLKGAAIVTSCRNTAPVKCGTASTAIRIGGVIADLTSAPAYKSQIFDCYNSGDIEAFSNSGGVVGYVTGDSARIERSYNIGNVTGAGTAYVNIAGLVGSGNITVIDCWNAGDVTGKGSQVGGINGTNTSKGLTFARNANYGNITGAANSVGGMIGLGRALMSDCANYGRISGGNAVAGLMGSPGNVAAAAFLITINDSYNAGEVECAGANVGNITAENTSCKYIEVGNCYFDSSKNKLTAYDTKIGGVTGLAPAELYDRKISDGFINAVASYPTIKGFEKNEINSFHVAQVLISERETTDSIATPFLIGTPQGAVWTASSNLIITDGKVTPKPVNHLEEATLTLKAGGKERVYTFRLAKTGSSGVCNIGADKEVKFVQYFRADGSVVASPEEAGGVVIERTVYTDGTSRTRKLVPVQR